MSSAPRTRVPAATALTTRRSAVSPNLGAGAVAILLPGCTGGDPSPATATAAGSAQDALRLVAIEDSIPVNSPDDFPDDADGEGNARHPGTVRVQPPTRVAAESPNRSAVARL